ncbi:Rab guanyl-nucleotide exchange factor [Aureococcus anophagefferens]|nr:Rab guanyl-nucleotide exchange factor [Aureococcus anophagefferens]
MPVWVRFRCASRTVETHNVALSRSGKSVLFGGASKEVKLCDVTTAALRYEARADDRVRAVALCGDDEPSWSAKHRGKVWTVSVTPDGTRVAAGDYANAVVLYAAADGAVLWLKTPWLGKARPSPGPSTSPATAKLAIGHWDAYAYLVDAADLREFGAIERGDRVAVALSSDGALVAAAAGTSAAVYAVDGDHIAALFETVHEAFAGSDHRSPADFWSDFLVKAGARFRYFEHRESDDGAAHRPSGAFHARNSLRHMLSRRSFDGGRAGAAPTFANFATLGGAGVRAHLKKTEVAAMIVPFERVLGTFGATP